MAGMDEPANRPAADDPEMAQLAADLGSAVEAALPGWVEASVARIHELWSGPPPAEVRARAEQVGSEAAAEVGGELRRLLAADIDEQWTNPLTLLRRAVRYPTAVLREAGVPPIVRDRFDEEHFPDDDYGLTPSTFADVDPSLHELGLVWGAMKARAHLRRHGGPAGRPPS
jgi:hypothetical protein